MRILILPTALAAIYFSSCAPAKREDPKFWMPKITPRTRKSIGAVVVGETPAGMRPPTMIDKLSAHQTLWAMRGVSLKLDLGDRKSVVNSSAHRTDSRYSLVDGSGALLVSAESTLAIQDLDGDWDGGIRILEDPSTMTLFIAEEHSWSVQRYIILSPSGDPTAGKWSARYVRIPIRDNATGMGDPPKLLGLKGNKIYVTQDNQCYALPLDGLEVEHSLEYTIG